MLQYSIYHILEIKRGGGGSYQQYIADFPQQYMGSWAELRKK